MPRSPVFVGRGVELSRLNTALNCAIAGQGNICFITGNAGSGKTALVGEFTHQALAKNKKLITAFGLADATTGIGDAYLPFREILAQLTGDVEAKLSQGTLTQEHATRLRKLLGLSGEIITELGPDLIGVFIPGAGLAARAAAFAINKTGWIEKLSTHPAKLGSHDKKSVKSIDQAHLFEQYTNVLRKISQRHPIILVLDDLHWADSASCELFFHISRRIQGYPILLVGAYRPDEVALGRNGERHPMDKVVNELKRYFGDIFIELDQLPGDETRTFMDEYIDSEPNLLRTDFRQLLYDLTGGHPLFTIELLRNMQERGDLVRDANGNWVTSTMLNWDDLPTKVEGVIEERLNRLGENLRQALSIGSVEGETFTAEIIARIQKNGARELIRNLSAELEKKHRLVNSQGIQSTPKGRISLYCFQHNLLQRYLYNDLREAERAYLHEDIGYIMEDLFNGQTERVAVQLAHHFTQSGLPEKALPYLKIAGEQALNRYANQEALHYFTSALGITPPADLENQYRLHQNCEHIYNLLGERVKQKLELDSLENISSQMDDTGRKAEVSLYYAGYRESIGEYSQAIQAIEQCISQARSAERGILEAQAHQKWGYILWRQGNYQDALTHQETALELANQIGDLAVKASALREMGVNYWRLGEYQKSEDFFLQALPIYNQLEDRLGEGSTLSSLGNLYLGQKEFKKAQDHYQLAIKKNQQVGNKRGEMSNLGNLGIIAAMEGEFTQAYSRFNQILRISREINDRESEGRALGNLGGLMMEPGQYARSWEYFSDALQIFQNIGSQIGCCWILADMCLNDLFQGRLEQALEESNAAFSIAEQIGNKQFQNTAIAHRARIELTQNQLETAGEDYQRSLAVSFERNNLSDEIDALAGLARLAQISGEKNQARTYSEQIWQKFDPVQVTDPECRSWTLLTCYRIFHEMGDPRHKDVLQKAHQLLMQHAKKYEDESLRRSFLENVEVNRQIDELVKASQAGLNIG